MLNTDVFEYRSVLFLKLATWLLLCVYLDAVTRNKLGFNRIEFRSGFQPFLKLYLS